MASTDGATGPCEIVDQGPGQLHAMTWYLQCLGMQQVNRRQVRYPRVYREAGL